MHSLRHPYLNETEAFIYILRHPKDILLSNLNYFRLVGNAQIDEEAFAKAFIENEGVPRWKSMGMGSWTEHARSWLTAPTVPHLLLHYEALLDNPHKNLRQVVDFLDLGMDENKLKRAVHLSSFSKMKQLEHREKVRGKYSIVFSGTPEATKSGVHFMNKGEAGQKLDVVGDHVEQLFNRRFETILPEFGY